MTELHAVLHALVEHPVAAPAPFERVAARGTRMRARRRSIRAGSVAAALGLLGGVGVLLQSDGRVPTTVVVSGGGATSAGYVATSPGGYEGAGAWRLTIVRDGRSIEYTSRTSPACGAVGTIQPGDEVRGEIGDDTSLLKAGDEAHC